MSKSISLTIGDFSCTVSGYEEPMSVVKEIASLFYVLPRDEFLAHFVNVTVNEDLSQAIPSPSEVQNAPQDAPPQDTLPERLTTSDEQAIERLLTQVEEQFRSPKTHRTSAMLSQLRLAAEQRQNGRERLPLRPNIFREENTAAVFHSSADAPLRLSPEQRVDSQSDTSQK